MLLKGQSGKNFKRVNTVQCTSITGEELLNITKGGGGGVHEAYNLAPQCHGHGHGHTAESQFSKFVLKYFHEIKTKCRTVLNMIRL